MLQLAGRPRPRRRHRWVARSRDTARFGARAGPHVSSVPCAHSSGVRGRALDERAPGSLAGSVAVVTGAGRGLGRGFAIALGAAGAAVGLVGRSHPELEAAAAQIRQTGGTALALPG